MPNDDAKSDLGDVRSIPIASHLSLAVQSGLPLESGLLALAQQTRSRRSKKALLKLSQNLERGMPLADALKESKDSLPNSMRALVDAGMEAGQLNAVMQYGIEQSHRIISLRQHIALSLSYPVFLVFFSAMICGGILVYIIPVLGHVMDDLQYEMPSVTRVVINLSTIVSVCSGMTWIVLLIAGFGVIFCVVWIGMSKWGQRRATSIPLIGRAFRFAALSEFCQVLAILVESGLTLPKALRAGGQASDDFWLNRKCRTMIKRIEAGEPPDDSAIFARLPLTLAQVFRNANSEQNLIEALRGLSDIYSAQCFVACRVITTIVVPLSVTTVVTFVCITAFAILYPMIKMVHDFS